MNQTADQLAHGQVMHMHLRPVPHRFVYPVPMTERVLAGALLRYPLPGLGIVFGIHWHSLGRWLKRVPFFSKPRVLSHHTTEHQEPAP